MLHSHDESDRVVSILSNYGLVPQAVVVVLFDATIMLLPITLAIGLLRHRLFDAEVVLRRSLAYGALCLAVALGYVGLTAALGIAVGAYLPVSLALLLTIIATQLFQAPRWLEGLADYGVGRGARYAEEIEGAAYFV